MKKYRTFQFSTHVYITHINNNYKTTYNYYLFFSFLLKFKSFTNIQHIATPFRGTITVWIVIHWSIQIHVKNNVWTIKSSNACPISQPITIVCYVGFFSTHMNFRRRIRRQTIHSVVITFAVQHCSRWMFVKTNSIGFIVVRFNIVKHYICLFTMNAIQFRMTRRL